MPPEYETLQEVAGTPASLARFCKVSVQDRQGQGRGCRQQRTLKRVCGLQSMQLRPSLQVRASQSGCSSPRSPCPSTKSLPRTPPPPSARTTQRSLSKPQPHPKMLRTPVSQLTAGMKGKVVSCGHTNAWWPPNWTTSPWRVLLPPRRAVAQ